MNGRQAGSSRGLAESPRDSRVVPCFPACHSLMNIPDIRIGWCGAIPFQYYVFITFRGPDTGVTIFSWSGVSDKFLGFWGVILTHPHALASQFISISLKGGFFSVPKQVTYQSVLLMFWGPPSTCSHLSSSEWRKGLVRLPSG